MRVFISLLALAACGKSSDSVSDASDTDTDTDTDADTDADTDTDTDSDLGTPASGSWSYTETSLDEDSCSLADLIGLSSGSFVIVNTGGGAFTVDDGTYLFDCTLDGDDFTCPDRFGGVDTANVYGVNFTVAGEAHGTFTAATEGAGSQSASVDCGDANCEAVAAGFGMTLPCVVAVSYTISL